MESPRNSASPVRIGLCLCALLAALLFASLNPALGAEAAQRDSAGRQPPGRRQTWLGMLAALAGRQAGSTGPSPDSGGQQGGGKPAGAIRPDMTIAEIEGYEPEPKPKRPRGPWPWLAGWLDEEPLHWLSLDYAAGLAGSPTRLAYRTRLYCRSSVGGQRSDFGFTQHDLVVRSPADWYGMGGAFAKFRAVDVHPRPFLPGARRRFPRRLYNAQVGASFVWPLPPGAYNVTIGSASDRPFDSNDEVTVDATWLIGCPTGEDSWWAVFLNWQNNRDYLNRCLVPGFVWGHQEGEWLTLALGFPANALAWRPSDRLELAASYVFPRSVYTEVRYRLWKGLKIYAGFDWTSQRYFLHDRLRSRDRLWYLEKRLSVGLRWHVSENLFFDAAGGYAFDRLWFEGETYEDRGLNRLNIADGAFLSFQFGARF